MVFTSFDFIFFLPISFFLYWLIFNRISVRTSNLFLIAISYIFYGWCNWKLCLLLFAISLTTYLAGQAIYHFDYGQPEIAKRNKRLVKTINIATIIVCIGVLGVFKYSDFFIQSVASVLNQVGFMVSMPTLNLILPLGISFYVFQSLTYTIDIYQGKFTPPHGKKSDIIDYLAFMSFFPQLLSGPIGRASRLLPQYSVKRDFNYDFAIKGCWQILWGLFMKVCVADRLSTYVDTIYDNLSMHNGTSVVVAAIFYSIQIYCDFAGYSLMAIGCGKLFGIKLDENFRQPYFANSIPDFWRRWHISLSTWFRDYVYIPLGGNRVKEWRVYFNLFITFLVSGLWHGAAWSFVIWGMLHGVYQICGKLWNKYVIRRNESRSNIINIAFTFALVTIAWVFFRITDISVAIDAIAMMFTSYGSPFIDLTVMVYGTVSIILLFIVDFISFRYSSLLESVNNNKNIVVVSLKYFVAIALVIWIVCAGVFSSGQFIYFKF